MILSGLKLIGVENSLRPGASKTIRIPNTRSVSLQLNTQDAVSRVLPSLWFEKEETEAHICASSHGNARLLCNRCGQRFEAPNFWYQSYWPNSSAWPGPRYRPLPKPPSIVTRSSLLQQEPLAFLLKSISSNWKLISSLWAVVPRQHIISNVMTGERENKAIELMTMGKLDDLITRMTESQEKILTLWTKSQEKR